VAELVSIAIISTNYKFSTRIYQQYDQKGMVLVGVLSSYYQLRNGRTQTKRHAYTLAEYFVITVGATAPSWVCRWIAGEATLHSWWITCWQPEVWCINNIAMFPGDQSSPVINYILFMECCQTNNTINTSHTISCLMSIRHWYMFRQHTHQQHMIMICSMKVSLTYMYVYSVMYEIIMFTQWTVLHTGQ